MAITAAAMGSQLAVIGTEHVLSQQAGLAGIYILVVDTSAMVSGDTLTLNLKSKVGVSTQMNLAYSYAYSDLQADPNKYSVPIPIDVEILCTLTQSTGIGKTFPWKLLRA